VFCGIIIKKYQSSNNKILKFILMVLKNTKIICTIGPATESIRKLRHLIKAGMNCARLNFSHGTYEHHAKLIRNVRAVSEKMDEPIAIIQDLQGPRIRIGELPEDGVEIKRGEEVVLAYEKAAGSLFAPLSLTWIRTEKSDPAAGIGSDKAASKSDKAASKSDKAASKSDKAASKSDKATQIILPTQENLGRIVKKGEIILIKDGLVRLRAISVLGACVKARVEQGGVITSNRGINLPESKITNVVITKKDKEDLKFGLKQKVDWIALSFVRDKSDVEHLRGLLPKGKSYQPKIIAKIERKEAVENFDAILAASDAIMVARGDLGIELPAEEIPLLQKEFIEKCLKASKPVIVATQMLESMTTNSRPTRAEVSDVANAVIDHTDAVMLSSETSTGKYPIATCQMMRNIIIETEESPYDDDVKTRGTNKSIVPNIIAHTAEDIVGNDHIRAIVVMSSSGKSAQLIASERPSVPVIALTQNDVSRKQMALIWGVRPFIMKRQRNVDDLIQSTVKLVKRELKVKKGDKIIIASGHPTGPHGSLNLLKIHTV